MDVGRTSLSECSGGLQIARRNGGPKSFIRKILRVSYFRSRFCEDLSETPERKCFENKILAQVIRKMKTCTRTADTSACRFDQKGGIGLCGLKTGAVPLAGRCSGFVGALEKIQQGGGWRFRQPHVVVH